MTEFCIVAFMGTRRGLRRTWDRVHKELGSIVRLPRGDDESMTLPYDRNVLFLCCCLLLVCRQCPSQHLEAATIVRWWRERYIKHAGP